MTLADSHALIDGLTTHGLVQFGRFIAGGQAQPLRFSLTLLPAYPHLLNTIADALAARIDHDVAFLLCGSSDTPLGTAVSLRTGIPLVFSAGQGQPPARDLIGAYDVGHHATLVSYQGRGLVDHQSLVRNAQRVGLDVVQYLAVLDVSEAGGDGILNVFDLVETMQRSGKIPTPLAANVRNWLETGAIHRPDSTGP